MKRLALLGVVAIGACSTFHGDDGTPVDPDAGTPDGGVVQGGGGNDAIGLTVTAAATPLFLVQGAGASVQLKLTRSPNVTSAVRVTVANLPADAVAQPVDIGVGATDAMLTIVPALTTPEGAIDLDLEATTTTPGAPTLHAKATLSSFVRGRAGDLDTTFGNAGIVLAPGYTLAGSVILPDDSIVANGVIKVTSAGKLDTTFGTGGTALLSADDGFAVTSDATIYGLSGMNLAKLSAGGVRDMAFGGGGTASTDFGIANTSTLAPALAYSAKSDSLFSMQWLLNDYRHVYIGRFGKDGSQDASWGTSKVCTMQWAGTETFVSARMVPRVDGGVFLLGGLDSGTSGFYMGACSPSGAVELPLKYVFADALPKAGVALADGSIYVVVNAPVVEPQLSVLHLSATGTIDGTFATSGHANAFGGAAAIAVQKDGKIVLAGSDTSAKIARLDAKGVLDAAFGAAGVASLLPGGSFTQVHVASDGRIVAVGAGTVGGTAGGVVARFWP